jgi:hypothetical protein
MAYPKFDEKELKIVSEVPGFFPGMPSTPVYDFPMSGKEAYLDTMKRKPVWMVTGVESAFFTPKINVDNIARGFVFDGEGIPREEFGGKDMFGIEWVYVDVAGGSMVKPGKPFLSDANEWYDKLVWPDVDSWDWEASAKANKNFFDPNKFTTATILNGYFERLISFMDFDGAIIAMIDEDQKDAVKDLFEKLTDLYIQIIDKYIESYAIDGFSIHDDWGAQKDTFFSPAVVQEMLIAPMTRLVDHVHSKGFFVDFHSCGMNEKQVPNMITIGWDSWIPMTMNDVPKLYDLYGDKLIFGVTPEEINPDIPEEEQRKLAKEFVERFSQPGKPITVSAFGAPLTPAYREELYKQSRIKYAE